MHIDVVGHIYEDRSNMNETVLEMHFHNALMELVRTTLGLGAGRFNFYKYSPQKECFVGFDQAYVRTNLSEDDLFNQLRTDAINNGYSLSNFFIGLFLQYKVVKSVGKSTRTTPRTIRSRPYLRVSIDTHKNDRTGFSQHELLFNLSRNNGAFVYYACPMIFEREQLYRQPADLSLLRLIDLTSCPSDYPDNESHFIFFDNINSIPFWRSDPVQGEVLSPSELFQKVRDGIQEERMFENQKVLLENLLSYPGGELDTAHQPFQDRRLRLLDMLHESLTILRYQSEG